MYMHFAHLDVNLQSLPNVTNSFHCCVWLQLQVQGQNIDFIKYNARAAGKTVPRRSQSMTNLRERPVPSAVKGQVPQ